MIFQSGKYCDIRVVLDEDEISVFSLRIRDKGQDTHLDIACTDLPHALELWTAIERSPEVKIVVNVNDYIVKDKPCRGMPACTCPNCEKRREDEFAGCKHRSIAKEDCDLREFDLEEME